MKIYLISLTAMLWAFCVRADRHSDAERDHHPECIKLATGDFQKWKRGGRSRYVWPVQLLSIGHTIASYQNYSRSQRAPYFHHGLDIRADAGSAVFASAGGKVVNIENYMPGDPAYWEIAILDDDGFLWQYHHVDKNSIPTEIHQAFKNGSKISPGTKIGEVFSWMTTSFGERYHHVHLNILGRNKEYLNPFAFLEPIQDNQPPEIRQIQLGKNGAPVAGISVSGNYTLLAEVSDLIRHQKYLVPPHSISIEIDGQMPQMVWEFEGLPGGSSNTAYVKQLWVSNTCGNYTCRRHIIDLAFSPSGRRAFPSSPGPHKALVRVRDFEGNMAEKTFEWTVE